MRSMVEGARSGAALRKLGGGGVQRIEDGVCIRTLHRLRRSPYPVNGGGWEDQPRATWKPANDWLTGISSSALMFKCGGRVATQNRVSAMSSPVMGWAPP